MRVRAQSSVIARLPVELMDEIARYSSPVELKILCLVCKWTGKVATRRLYHTIVLKNSKNAILCFKSLKQRQDLASCVRRIAIGVLLNNLLGNFYKLAAAALARTTNLIGLDISGHYALLPLLAEISFPRLTEAKVPYGPRIITFLQTNQRVIKAIVIDGPKVITPNLELSSRHFTNVHLPELLAFVGPCNIIPHVVPGSQVQFLTVCWEPGCERLEEIVRCVAQSRREVLGMDNLVLGWNPALLSVIAECVPRIERLRIRNICPLVTEDMIEAYFLYLEQGLQKFEQLNTLAITIPFNPYEYQLEDLDDEYDLLRRWGLLMPTLIVCTLPSTTRWTRYKDNHWFPFVDPKGDPYKKLKIHWLFRAFKSGTYPNELFTIISGGINYEDVEPLVHLNDHIEFEEDFEDEDDEGELESDWEEGNGEDPAIDWDDDEASDWDISGGDIGSGWDSDWEEND